MSYIPSMGFEFQAPQIGAGFRSPLSTASNMPVPGFLWSPLGPQAGGPGPGTSSPFQTSVAIEVWRRGGGLGTYQDASAKRLITNTYSADPVSQPELKIGSHTTSSLVPRPPAPTGANGPPDSAPGFLFGTYTYVYNYTLDYDGVEMEHSDTLRQNFSTNVTHDITIPSTLPPVNRTVENTNVFRAVVNYPVPNPPGIPIPPYYYVGSLAGNGGTFIDGQVDEAVLVQQREANDTTDYVEPWRTILKFDLAGTYDPQDISAARFLLSQEAGEAQGFGFFQCWVKGQRVGDIDHDKGIQNIDYPDFGPYGTTDYIKASEIFLKPGQGRIQFEFNQAGIDQVKYAAGETGMGGTGSAGEVHVGICYADEPDLWINNNRIFANSTTHPSVNFNTQPLLVLDLLGVATDSGFVGQPNRSIVHLVSP